MQTYSYICINGNEATRSTTKNNAVVHTYTGGMPGKIKRPACCNCHRNYFGMEISLSEEEQGLQVEWCWLQTVKERIRIPAS